MIGDCRSAALVARSGSIDWLCWPNFDSPSVFGRLLDYERGGYFAISPIQPFRTERRYVGSSNVLETTFVTSTGRARLTDAMVAVSEERKRRWLLPLRSLSRLVEGLEGTVEMEVDFSPRPRYGATSPNLERRGLHDAFCQAGQDLYHLRSELPLVVQGSRCRRRFAVRAGEKRRFGLAFNQDAPAAHPAVGDEAELRLSATIEFWDHWSSSLSYAGPYRNTILRSALALKLLAFAPSGAIVAAPTTSLPETVGGERNWDYRYCWLRDASFTVRALYDLGFRVEGDAYVSWMLHATRLTHPALQVVYSIYGESHLPEQEMGQLEGYMESRPVRIGNAADSQFQLDVYGEVMEAIERYYELAGSLDSDTWRLVTGAAELVARQWKEPDHGIWESRGPKQQYVHGKVGAWLALDCAARMARKAGLRADVSGWEDIREEIRTAVLRQGVNRTTGTFVKTLGGSSLDGALLTLPLVGFIAGDDPIMLATIEAVRRELAVGDLVYRYIEAGDRLPRREGAFLTCSFWLVSSLAVAGKLDEAHWLFQRLLSRGNDLGLYPEEMDPATGQFLGNYPQGLTHIALINAALTLQQAESTLTAKSGRTFQVSRRTPGGQ